MGKGLWNVWGDMVWEDVYLRGLSLFHRKQGPLHTNGELSENFDLEMVYELVICNFTMAA